MSVVFFVYCISIFKQRNSFILCLLLPKKLGAINKKISPAYPEKTDTQGLLFDHMFDHLQNRSTWRQECQRARFDNFCVLERSKRSRNVYKMVNFTIGVVEAASSSLSLSPNKTRLS